MTREELAAAYQAFLDLEASKPAEGTDDFAEWQCEMDKAFCVLAEFAGSQRPEGATVQ